MYFTRFAKKNISFLVTEIINITSVAIQKTLRINENAPLAYQFKDEQKYDLP